MRFRVCSDVGGTFSDLFVFDENNGEWNIFKAFTVPRRPSDGIMAGLRQAADHYGLTLDGFLRDCVSLVHGSTVALNALIEGKVAKVGLICTRGFRDILTTREQGRSEPFLWKTDYPDPFVPRYLTLPVTERINSEGGVEVPLDEDDVRAAVRQLKGHGVQAIAVALLWSITNGQHERRIEAIIREEWPEVPVVLSSQLNPILREYRRTSSTVVNASLLEVIRTYVSDLQAQLSDNGYARPLSLVTSAGGIASVQDMMERPIYSINSGPSMAPIAGQTTVAMEQGIDNVLVVDMGGTSFDVSVVQDGKINLSREIVMGGCFLGVDLVDSRSVGSGGGSIARVDAGGLVHVGPESAGANPGPAFYGRGGTRPTVSDADLVLGYLNTEAFAKGGTPLDPALSSAAIEEHVAKPLGIDVAQAAFTMWSTVNNDMQAAMQDLAISRGIDLRDFVVVSGGGAAGMHIQAMAMELGIRELIIPKAAGVLSAYGGAFADLVKEYSAIAFAESNRFDFAGVNALLASLEERAVAFLDGHGIDAADRRLEFYAEARYPEQIWELPVPLRTGRIADQAQLDAMVGDFHDIHERMYAVKDPSQPIECLHWKVRAIGTTPKPAIRKLPFGGEGAGHALKGTRKAFFKELGGFVDTAVYDGTRLTCGNRIEGPAVIEEPTTTVVVMPGTAMTVSEYGSYVSRFA
ncbi:hydantoinase/oxoprolinase family protein [Sphingomonas histidinilytica]|uniref:N-methylhydantoinase A n=1 Tax=Rhizorhabdus histidinilytica TaxID=439228 RepID=A0A1T5GP20_9SPHN|nr:hydantoinase/oxoprolinase family protein [Rhizorhabdus histidinilytica]MBO9380346.1 hydantoinase/oxoprolinase family protein [Rhizorhabdus histidinilytica]QEH77029.1 hydantoinase/oxoprolinase family protein [Sphingomonas sp. C8-2]SKC10070.1 N-methylhydantoinase A [Rhizorhabdus histidinilytica]